MSCRFSTMTAGDLDEVVAIEMIAYEFPWSRRNFEDSLNSGYHGICMRTAFNQMVGYCVLMTAVDEVHLLNLCVAPAAQGAGAGLALLREAERYARELGMFGMLLEVRPSNARALRLYERYGFAVIGRRKNYYPARARSREHAIVMRLVLPRNSAYVSA